VTSDCESASVRAASGATGAALAGATAPSPNHRLAATPSVAKLNLFMLSSIGWTPLASRRDGPQIPRSGLNGR